MQAGDTVKIKPGYENCQDELLLKFVVIEAYENRALIQPLKCYLALIPTELVSNESIEIAV